MLDPGALLRREMQWGDDSFLSVDPVVANYADPQSFNAYSYARNNPVNLTDPTGMFIVCCTEGGTGPCPLAPIPFTIDAGTFTPSFNASFDPGSSAPGNVDFGGMNVPDMPNVQVMAGGPVAPPVAPPQAPTQPANQGPPQPTFTPGPIPQDAVDRLGEFAGDGFDKADLRNARLQLGTREQFEEYKQRYGFEPDAFTDHNNVYLKERPDLTKPRDLSLLAHELVHVRQFRTIPNFDQARRDAINRAIRTGMTPEQAFRNNKYEREAAIVQERVYNRLRRQRTR